MRWALINSDLVVENVIIWGGGDPMWTGSQPCNLTPTNAALPVGLTTPTPPPFHRTYPRTGFLIPSPHD
jgi:hypothetical protein